MSSIIVAQSGGPTTAINASLVGVIEAAAGSGQYEKIYGAIHGISGVLKEDFLELGSRDSSGRCVCDTRLMEEVKRSPASYLGSCRFKMPEESADPELYQRIFDIFDRYEVDAFFYIGGNDSMDTVAKLSQYGAGIDSTVKVVGVPKTIDNDLVLTDHTPGFGSAAKFIAVSMLEMAYDTAVYEAPCVTIVEIMGRDSGWLTASAALARNSFSPIPQLIYLPERDFDREEFIRSLSKLLESTTNIVVAVSEGIHDSEGRYLSAGEAANDRFGHAQLSGTGKVLERLVRDRLHIKCRSVELNIPQRCGAHLAAMQDIRESYELGEAAVRFSLEGESGFMPVITRTLDSPYSYEIDRVEVAKVANYARRVPDSYINAAGNDITPAMLTYLRPLIQGELPMVYENGLPVYADISHLVTIHS